MRGHPTVALRTGLRGGVRGAALLGAALVVMVAVLALQSGVARADTPQALVLGDSVYPGLPSYAGLPGATPTESIEQYEAEQDGYNVTVVDGATWDSMTAAQFASYQVLIIGDPDCAPYDGIGYQFQAAVTNESTWEPVVMASGGNKVLIGTDPTFHWYGGSGPNANILEENGIAYAGAVAGATGAYVDLSCTYSSVSPGTAVPLLDGLSTFGPGSFTVGGAPCDGPVSIIAATGPTAGLPDSDLANWECSVHEFFDTFPADYTPLALATGTDEGVPVTYTGTDVDTGASVSGSPYIMISGGGITVTSDLTVTPATQTLPVSTAGTVTANLVSGPSGSTSPVSGASVTFDVTSGPDAGQTFTGTTDGSGNVSFTYTNDGSTGTDQIVATSINGGVTTQGTASITWTSSGPAGTQLSTSLSGGGSSGATISVPAGTAVTDQGTLIGTNASTATGSVTYNVYSDSGCTDLVSGPDVEGITTPGTIPSSASVTLSTPGTYYWQATYGGDSANDGSTSMCGSEVETVTSVAQPTWVSTWLGGWLGTDYWSGLNIAVPSGSSESDSATLSGSNVSSAGGTVTYTVYSDSGCTDVVGTPETVTVTGGTVPNSTPIELAPGTYYYVASYSGDPNNAPSSSTCGSETVDVTPPSGGADIQFSLAGTTTSIGNGGTEFVPVTVTNAGPMIAKQVCTALLVPKKFAIVSANGATQHGQLLVLCLPYMNPGQSYTLDVYLTVPSSGSGSATIVGGSLSFKTIDPNYKNNFGAVKVAYGPGMGPRRVAKAVRDASGGALVLARLRALGPAVTRRPKR